MNDWPVRQKSLRGQPRPETSIERTCETRRASFAGSAAGKTGERGIWRDWAWYCSVECDPKHGVFDDHAQQWRLTVGKSRPQP